MMSRDGALMRRMPLATTPTQFAVRGHPYLLLTIGCGLISLIALGAILPLLSTSGWWWQAAAAVVVASVSAGLLRRWGVRAPFVPLLTAAVLLAYFTLVYGAGSGLLFILPTPETLGIFGALIAEGQFSIQTQTVPAEPTPGIIFLLALGGALLVMVVDALAIGIRMPALAGLPVALVLLLPTLILRQDEQIVVLVLAAVAYLLLLRVDVRTRRGEELRAREDLGAAASQGGPRIVVATKQMGVGPLGAALGVGSAAIVSALVLTAATPVVTMGAQLGVGPPSTSLFGGAVNPLIDLGQDLRRPRPAPALSYSSTGSRAVYLKMLTLDSFANDSWIAGQSTFNASNTIDKIGRPPGLSDEVATVPTVTRIDVDNVRSEWLPVPYPATSIEGLEGQWYWDSEALTVATTGSSIGGQSYVVNGLELAPTQDELAAAGTLYAAYVAPYVQLPDDMPPLISETARAAVGEAATPYEQAAALQKFLRGRDFSYSEETPVDDGFDGGGMRAIASFLEVRAGYCIHFASAMAVMARTLDIPSRISLGYAPGTPTRDKVDGETVYTVLTTDLHAWPELYFEGIGWVPFEPTPGRGVVPGYSIPVVSPAAPGVPQPETPGAAVPGGESRGLDELGRPTSQTGEATAQGILGRIAAVVGALLVLCSSPFLVRSVQRIVRRRRVRSGAPASLLWRELADTLSDYGYPVRETDTPRGRSAAMRRIMGERNAVTPEVEEALARLVLAVEQESFGRPSASDAQVRGQASDAVATARGIELDRDLATVCSALHAQAPLARRARAAVLPASLFASLRRIVIPSSAPAA